MNVAINLLWVRPGKVGGTESYIRNILNGLLELSDSFHLVLLVSKDNYYSFKMYDRDARIRIIKCDVESAKVSKRILWENIHLGRIIRHLGIKTCFVPTYGKPILGGHGIKFITTIHDLQAIHYPEYFSKAKVIWMKFSWWNAVRTSAKIIAISNFVKDDLIEHFPAANGKTDVIYNAIQIDDSQIDDFNVIKKHYDVTVGGYFFTVSSLLPHKNLKTLILAIAKLNQEDKLAQKLIISGVGGKSHDALVDMIAKLGLINKVILTPFIPDSERNALYKYCKAFLFPSLFEGFGMPPVEAMHFGAPVLTTREASLQEVTQGLAAYVNNPLDVDEWAKAILDLNHIQGKVVDFSEYESTVVAKQYFEAFTNI